MQKQYSIFCYRMDLYFRDFKPTIKIHQKFIDYKIKRQKAIEQELGSLSFQEFILANNTFDIFEAVN